MRACEDNIAGDVSVLEKKAAIILRCVGVPVAQKHDLCSQLESNSFQRTVSSSIIMAVKGEK